MGTRERTFLRSRDVSCLVFATVPLIYPLFTHFTISFTGFKRVGGSRTFKHASTFSPHLRRCLVLLPSSRSFYAREVVRLCRSGGEKGGSFGRVSTRGPSPLSFVS